LKLPQPIAVSLMEQSDAIYKDADELYDLACATELDRDQFAATLAVLEERIDSLSYYFKKEVGSL
jgi:hypothetical protein